MNGYFLVMGNGSGSRFFFFFGEIWGLGDELGFLREEIKRLV